MKFWKPFALAAAGTLALASAFSALAADKKVVVGYQTDALPSAVVELNAKLLQSSDQRVVASRTFLVAKPATTTAIPQVVEAFEQSLQTLGQEVVSWTLAEGEADARRKR